MRRDSPIWWIIGGVALIAALATGGTIAVMAYWKQSALAQKWLPYLNDAEAYYNLPADLLARMAYQESHFRQDIIDGSTVSPAGALGLMQLEPQYYQTVNRPLPFTDADTQDQIEESAQTMARLYADLKSWPLAIAAYDAGEGAVKKYKGVPPFTETQNYVSQVLADVPAANA